jgi:hypothetical protein
MNESGNKDRPQETDELGEVKSEWGKPDAAHYGYESEEERLAKRGLEDWELVDKIPESQRNVPKWFLAVIAVVLLVAIGLSFPFWGDRPGYERSWFNWGFAGAIVYIAVMASFVYFMVNLYGSHAGGKLDSDKSNATDPTPEDSSEEQGNDAKH